MTDDDPKISQSGLEAIEILLHAAKAHGIGLTIEPDPVGWHIGYILETGGGHLASAYDLETAVRAAERPLDELADLLAAERDQFLMGDEDEPGTSDQDGDPEVAEKAEDPGVSDQEGDPEVAEKADEPEVPEEDADTREEQEA
jgi:hypothetical protein